MSTGIQPLAGKHALVTGASRGIGEAIARRLLDEGARVTLLGRTLSSVAEVATRLDPVHAFAVSADVVDVEQMRWAFHSAAERFGPIDILVNNAGQAGTEPMHKAGDELWHTLLAVNLTGTYHGIRCVWSQMLGRNFGRIVNIASTAGLKGYPYASAYCASKHGVIGLTRSLALEAASRNVTINAVCPGYTDTDLVRQAIENIRTKTSRSAEEARAALLASNPQRRLIRSDEVANVVAWLCLPGSESITGQSIAVAGGEVM